MAIKMRTEVITPALAAQYLKKNGDNYRRISRAKVNLYAEEMKAGKWQMNGEAIVFDKAGKLKNGQHRLAAIIIAGVPVEMTIIEGVDDDVTIYDVGMTRSVKQIAAASGCGDITGTEAAVGSMIVGNFSSKVPRGKVLDWLKDHYTDVHRASRICGANTASNLARRASCVLATYMILQIDDMKSFDLETFWKIFNSGNVVGTDGYEPSSALVARRAFMERYKSMPNDTRRQKEQVETLIKAIRDFQKGNTRQVNYPVKDPLICEKLMDQIRRADGLEETMESA